MENNFKIIAVTDIKSCREDILDRTEKLARYADALILRAKELDAFGYQALAEEALKRCKKAEAENKLVLHYYYETAEKLGLGVQLPVGRLGEFTGRRSCKFSGVSVHSADEAKKAEDSGAAYAVYGHIFETGSKPGLQPRGLKSLKDVVRAVDIPVFAIGGINAGNIASVRDAGAAGACIMSGFMRCENVELFARKLRDGAGCIDNNAKPLFNDGEHNNRTQWRENIIK